MFEKKQLFHILISKFITRFLNDINYRILWLEGFLCSAIVGGLFHSWVVFSLIALGLSWLLNRKEGVFYMIYYLSFIWSVVALLIGYFLSGWGWGLVWAALIWICSLNIHYRDLQQPLFSIKDIESDNHTKKWYLREQNFN